MCLCYGSQEGSFAFVFKSQHFPDEIVAARRGSPLLVGVKTDRKLKVDFVDVELPTADTTEKRKYEQLIMLPNW